MPEISVIIPVYNSEKYLELCLDSILLQTYTDFEILLIDDGSIDGSAAICSEYARRDKRIKMFSQQHAGISTARNIGINNSSGKYITFIDSDDLVEKNYLKTLRTTMQDASMGICGVSNKLESLSYSCKANHFTPEETQILVCKSIKSGGLGGGCFAKIFEKNLLDEYSIRFDEKIGYCEDLNFVFRYISYCQTPICYSNAKLYYYRTNDGEISMRRYNMKDYIDPLVLTEFEGVLLSMKFAVSSISLKAIRIRLAKAACNTLRVMVANRYVDSDLYSDCLHYVRKNCIRSLINPILDKSSQVSVLLSAISPRLEWFVFKKMLQIKRILKTRLPDFKIVDFIQYIR